METAERPNQTISPNTQLPASTSTTDSTTPTETLSHSHPGSISSNPQPKPEKEKEKQQDKDKDAKDTKKPSKPKVVLNISDTRYDVVRYVGKKLLGYKVTKDLEVEWDVFWTDNAVQPEQLARMQPFQKINHFPGMYSLARKNHLGRNLMRMKKAFPENFKFFPQTYLLPAEYSEFKMQFGNRNKSKTFIVKPEASCQGRGIFLTRTYEDIQPGEHYVVQRYLHKPFLLDGLKFDMRIYVLLAGCDPLRIYLFDDGLGRFATEEYIAPTAENLENMCMHLTNYAINKDNPNFVFNESADKNDVGHKRSLKAVMKALEEKGYDVKTLWNDIKKIIIKTLCSVQPILAHSYKSCQPDEPNNNMCFEILGIDIMLDHKLKPWLLEVNHTPSFTTDTPLDKTIKQNVIRDALVLMNVSAENRFKYKNKKKAELQQRVLTGKKPKVSLEERQAIAAKAQLERDEWESQHLGGFEKIYPFDDPSKAKEDYSEFIRVAQKWWEEWTGTAAKKVVKKPAPEKEGRLPPMTFGQVNTAPAGVNGNVRAKEIQTVYSQKMKLGSQTLKNPSSSQQKTRVNTASVSASTTTQGGESAVDKSATKAQVTSNNDDLQPWSMKSPLEQYRVVGEDETDYFEEMMVPVREEEEDAVGNDEPPAGGAQFDLKFPGRVALTDSVQKNSTLSNLSTNSEIANLSSTQGDSSKISTFRIKRMSGIEGVKESPCRPIQGRADKENAKSVLIKKPESRMGLQSKGQPSQSASNSMYLTKAPEKLAEVYGVRETTSDKTVRATKTALKLGNGVFGSLASTLNTEEHGTIATVNEFETEKKVKSSGYGSLGRVNSHKNSLRAPSKKGTYLSVQQPKDATFLVPKMFELNIQGAKQEQTKESAVYTGLKNFGRSLSKGVILPGNQSGGINACFQDSQFNVQKTIM